MTSETVLIGVGYVGTRFLNEHDAIGLSRADYDLDHGGDLPVSLPAHYTILYTVPPSRHALQDVRLHRLLDQLQPAPQRFVYISTTGVYGNHNGADVDENTDLTPESDRAQRRVDAEATLQQWGEDNGVAVVILRVPGIYGPGRLGIDRLREGAPVIAAQDCGPGNRIHVDDLVACCAAALAEATPAGIYNVGDGDHRSSTWFSNEVAQQCGLQAPPTISMADAAREFSPMRMSFLRESRRVDTRKMRDVLGFTPKYANAEDGIRAALNTK